jgi:hypothetical protein
LTESDLGPVFATVAFKLEGNVQDPGYQMKNGDAAFIAFHLTDGTVVTRAYWLDTGELARGILLPKAFGLAIEAAVPASREPEKQEPPRQ